VNRNLDDVLDGTSMICGTGIWRTCSTVWISIFGTCCTTWYGTS